MIVTVRVTAVMMTIEAVVTRNRRTMLIPSTANIITVRTAVAGRRAVKRAVAESITNTVAAAAITRRKSTREVLLAC
jgi:hypothetical protein